MTDGTMAPTMGVVSFVETNSVMTLGQRNRVVPCPYLTKDQNYLIINQKVIPVLLSCEQHSQDGCHVNDEIRLLPQDKPTQRISFHSNHIACSSTYC